MFRRYNLKQVHQACLEMKKGESRTFWLKRRIMGRTAVRLAHRLEKETGNIFTQTLAGGNYLVVNRQNFSD